MSDEKTERKLIGTVDGEMVKRAYDAYSATLNSNTLVLVAFRVALESVSAPIDDAMVGRACKGYRFAAYCGGFSGYMRAALEAAANVPVHEHVYVCECGATHEEVKS